MHRVEKKYPYAVIATDVGIFTIKDHQLHVLLINMKKAPFAGMWAIPGGLVKGEESVDTAARRHLFEKTGVQNVYLEQLATFGEVDRDPFGRVVSVAYMALIASHGLHLSTTSEYGSVQWFNALRSPKLAYDHAEILKTAITRLRARLQYTNIAYTLLPKKFTLTQLQEVYEIILGTTLDRRNFRKKILSLGIIRKTEKRQEGRKNRPAGLYTFVHRSPRFVEIM